MLPADVVEGDPKKLKRPQSKVSQVFESINYSFTISKLLNACSFEKNKTGNPPAVNPEKPNKKMRSGTDEQADNPGTNVPSATGNGEESITTGPPAAEPVST
jgi:hypothetical protein